MLAHLKSWTSLQHKKGHFKQKCMLHREPETETERERAREREIQPERQREPQRFSLWLSLNLSGSLWLSEPSTLQLSLTLSSVCLQSACLAHKSGFSLPSEHQGGTMIATPSTSPLKRTIKLQTRLAGLHTLWHPVISWAAGGEISLKIWIFSWHCRALDF